MLTKIKNFFVTLVKKIDSLFHVVKDPKDWSSTSFLSVFAVVVPILVWVIMCFIAMSVLAMPESILAIIVVGLTGKVLDKNNKLKKENGNGK